MAGLHHSTADEWNAVHKSVRSHDLLRHRVEWRFDWFVAFYVCLLHAFIPNIGNNFMKYAGSTHAIPNRKSERARKSGKTRSSKKKLCTENVALNCPIRFVVHGIGVFPIMRLAS